MKKGVLIVTVVLAVVLLLGLGTAMAQQLQYGDAILFPYFKSGGGDVTFFQIISTAKVQTPVTGTSQGKLDYVYVYNAGSEVCQHYDDIGRVTQNDILLYEATGVYPGQLLPGDTTSTSPKLTVSPAWGYLVVRHNSSNFTTGLEGTLFGQAYVANVNTGTIYAYNAINDPDEFDAFEFYQNATDANLISFLPETLASTVWYLFPVDGTNLISDIVWNNGVDIGSSEGGRFNFGGVFDNNESLKSGTKPLMAGCWDTTMLAWGEPADSGSGPVTANFSYTLSQIMSGAQYNAVKGTGGFSELIWVNGPLGESDSRGYLYKIQSSTVLGKPMSIFVYEPGFYTPNNFGSSDAVVGTILPLTGYSYSK